MLVAAIALLMMSGAVRTQAATVRVPIQLSPAEKEPAHDLKSKQPTVVWLSPTSTDPVLPLIASIPGHFRVEQKDKSFQPNFLVVPLGSVVDFPNRDPFFHNVFSQFNGKRFDLGLYEAGSNRSVRFDHEGVSYIFCNIHSQMAAVIIAVGTRFFTVVDGTGIAELNDVPPGDYILRVWRQSAEPSQLTRLARHIHVVGADLEADPIRMPAAASPAPHKNKFGEAYPPDDSAPYPR